MSVAIQQTKYCHILEDCVCNINCCENHRVYTVIVLLLLLCTICKVKSTQKCPSNILFHYCVLTFVLQRILDFNTCCGCFLDVEVFTVGYVMRKLANQMLWQGQLQQNICSLFLVGCTNQRRLLCQETNSTHQSSKDKPPCLVSLSINKIQYCKTF